MYRLARLLVGVAIQSIASDWADHFFGPDRANPYAGNYPYNINSDARINHGLTLESAVLFNLPTYQPPGFNQRGLRLNQTQCNLPNVPHGNDVRYLDTYVRDHLLYLTGQSEALINMHNGVYNSNRGSNDIISILIRRGRELGVPRLQLSVTLLLFLFRPSRCVRGTLGRTQRTAMRRLCSNTLRTPLSSRCIAHPEMWSWSSVQPSPMTYRLILKEFRPHSMRLRRGWYWAKSIG